MSDAGQAQERIYLMKFKDHKNISRYLVKSHDCRIKARNRWALIIGSVIPDIAFYTYFRGSFNGQKLKGHNYELRDILISASSFIIVLTHSHLHITAISRAI